MAIDELISLLPNAVDAKSFDRAGGGFGRRSNFIITIDASEAADPAGWAAARETFLKFGLNAKAYYVSPSFGGLCIEVFFDIKQCTAMTYFRQMISEAI